MISESPKVGGELLAVVGSYNDYWIKTDPNDSDSWALRRIQDGQVPANFLRAGHRDPRAVHPRPVVPRAGPWLLHRRRVGH